MKTPARALFLALISAALIAALVVPASANAIPSAPGTTVCAGKKVYASGGFVQAQPTITVDPPQAKPGDTVTVTIHGFLPGIEVPLILRIGGDPVVATGTTDASGTVVLTFQVPEALNGTYALRARNGTLCGIIGQLTILPGYLPTPTPTATRPATATPTRTATTPATPATATPTSTTAVSTPTNTPTKAATAARTPLVPVTGTGGGPDGPMGSTSNLAMIALGLLLMSGAFLGLRANRRTLAPAVAWVDEPQPQPVDEWTTDAIPSLPATGTGLRGSTSFARRAGMIAASAAALGLAIALIRRK